MSAAWVTDTLKEARRARDDGAPIHPQGAVAHAANETGYGSSQLGKPPHHNLFGAKATGVHTPFWAGEAVNLPTWEVVNGRRVDITAAFRSYPDARTAFLDYGDIISRVYPDAVAGAHRDLSFLAGLFLTGPRRWATDPAAFDKITRIIAMRTRELYPEDRGEHMYAGDTPYTADTLVLHDLTWRDRFDVLVGGREVVLKGAIVWRVRAHKLDVRRAA